MVYYLAFAPNSYFWWGFNIISQILFAASCCAIIASRRKITENERLLFWYMCGVNILRAVYTAFCTHAMIIHKDHWIAYSTNVFIILVAVTFFLFLIYLAKQKE